MVVDEQAVKRAFRVRHLISVLSGGWIAGVVLVVAVALAFVLTRLFGNSVAGPAIGRSEDLLVFVFAALAVIYVTATFITWWARRKLLTKVEHRVLLGILIFLSAWVWGVMSFSIYTIDNEAFEVDETKAKPWIEARTDALKLSSLKDRETALWLHSLRSSLEPVSSSFFRFKNKIPNALTIIRPIDVPLKGVEIALVREPDSSSPLFADRWGLGIREGERKLLLHPGLSLVTDFRLPAPGPDGVSKQYLLNALQSAERWQEYRSSLLASRNQGAIPATVFVYQSIMTVLGDNPEFVSPNSRTTHLLALLFAVAKFLYLGVFIALVVDRES
jgi:hypothetical protein